MTAFHIFLLPDEITIENALNLWPGLPHSVGHRS